MIGDYLVFDIKITNKNTINILERLVWSFNTILGSRCNKYAKKGASITCVDAWQPFFDMDVHADEQYAKEMEQLLESDFAYNVFLHNMGTLQDGIKTQHFRGQSENILPQLKDSIYDVVFIDADHTYGPVKKDIKDSVRLSKRRWG